MNRELIAEKYQILATLENFETEEFCLVKNIHNNQNYLLQYCDLSSLSTSEIDNVKEKINLIKNFANTPLNGGRFPRLIEMIENENNFHIIYEKIIGKTLKETFDNQELWTEREAISYFKYLLESLDLLHGFNLIHQLIKPENIIINNQNLFLSNYGKFINPQSALMMTVTIEDKLYIAPEQIQNKPHISSDIYALAMVIITLVTGKDILTLDEDDTGKIIWSEGVNLTDNFIKILDSAIAPKISQRYQNCQEVIAEINKLFPQQIAENIITAKQKNIAHYTPTEIIIPDDNLDSFNQEENQKTLNPTEFVDSTDYYKNKKQETINKTELIVTEEEEIKSLLPLAEEYLSNSDSLSSSLSRENLANINNNLSQKTSSLSLEHSQNNVIIFNNRQSPKGIIIAFIIAIFVIFSFPWFKNYLYEKKVENLIEQIKTYHQLEKYDECITLINSTTIQSLPIANSLTQEFLGKCWLGLAEKKALEGNFAEAIKTAVQIDNTSPDYNRARQFIDDWSEQLILEAKTLCETNHDIALIEEKLAPIPESSKWKKEALDLIDNCNNTFKSVPCPDILCPD